MVRKGETSEGEGENLNLSPKGSPTGSLCSHPDVIRLILKDAAPVQRCTALSLVFGGAGDELSSDLWLFTSFAERQVSPCPTWQQVCGSAGNESFPTPHLQKEISLCGLYIGYGRIQNTPLFGEVKLIVPVIGVPDTAQRVLNGENHLCLIQSLCIMGKKNPVCQLLPWLCSIRVHRAGFIFTWQFLCCYDFTNLQSINHLSKQHTNKLKSRGNFSKASFVSSFCFKEQTQEIAPTRDVTMRKKLLTFLRFSFKAYH